MIYFFTHTFFQNPIYNVKLLLWYIDIQYFYDNLLFNVHKLLLRNKL